MPNFSTQQHRKDIMAKKKSRRVRKPWTAADLKALKKLAGKSKLAVIAKQLSRTPGAVQQKASAEQISLAMKSKR